MEDANRLPRQPAANTRELLKNTLGMAWPAVLESFFIALAGMIDVKMVSNLGSYAVAAVGLTTQPKFLGLAFFIATNVALSALVARRLGEKRREDANQVMLTALVLSILVCAVISTLCVTLASPIIDLCGSQPDTHAAAVTYFRIIMGGILFSVVSMTINAARRELERLELEAHEDGFWNDLEYRHDHQRHLQCPEHLRQLPAHRRPLRLPRPGHRRCGHRHGLRHGGSLRHEPLLPTSSGRVRQPAPYPQG